MVEERILALIEQLTGKAGELAPQVWQALLFKQVYIGIMQVVVVLFLVGLAVICAWIARDYKKEGDDGGVAIFLVGCFSLLFWAAILSVDAAVHMFYPVTYVVDGLIKAVR